MAALEIRAFILSALFFICYWAERLDFVVKDHIYEETLNVDREMTTV